MARKNKALGDASAGSLVELGLTLESARCFPKAAEIAEQASI